MLKGEKVHELCCGCGACSFVCPKHCIEIKEDGEGFYYAYYDEKECIKCGKCSRICPMLHLPANEIINTYAFASLNNELYNRSSSGGVFSHIAQQILESGGKVWGCGYDAQMHPVHMEASCPEELDNIRRSKYVQSCLSDCYKKIEEELLSGVEVLFAGTPCQVGGLKNYLKQDFDNLFTIDLVCHGTPSAKFFKDNLEYIKKKYGEIDRYEFRLKQNDKSRKSYYSSYILENGKRIDKIYYKDPYFNEFYDMTSLNESCYQCPYASENRPGDITIGDYEWGKKHHQELVKFSDISCILVNTQKGGKRIKEIKDCILVETSIKNIEEKNLNLLRPTPRPARREYLYEEIYKKGYGKWADNYFKSFRYIKKMPLLRPLVKLKILINKMKKD